MSNGEPVIKRLARNTLIIPGKSNYPVDHPKGKKCPHCNEVILTLIPIKDLKKKKTKMICPACGKEIKTTS